MWETKWKVLGTFLLQRKKLSVSTIIDILTFCIKTYFQSDSATFLWKKDEEKKSVSQWT